MASFASLLRGGESGETTIEPGKPERSYLIELVETGDMPPRGNLSEPDIQTLKDWVRAGAEYDGKDKAEELAGLVPGGMRGGPGGPGGRAGRGFGPGGPQRGRRRLGQRGGR